MRRARHAISDEFGRDDGGDGGWDRVGRGCAYVVCPQVVECVAECGVLRALRIELTLGVGLCGAQPVVGPLRALSCGAGLKIYDLRCVMCQPLPFLSFLFSLWGPFSRVQTSQQHHPALLPIVANQKFAQCAECPTNQPTNLSRAQVREVRDQPTNLPGRPGSPMVACATTSRGRDEGGSI